MLGRRLKSENKLWWFTNSGDYQERINSLLARYPRKNPYDKSNWVNWEYFPTPDGYLKSHTEINNRIYTIKNEIYWWLKKSVFDLKAITDETIIDTENLIEYIDENYNITLSSDDLQAYLINILKENKIWICNDRGYVTEEKLVDYKYNEIRYYGKTYDVIKQYICLKYKIEKYSTNKEYSVDDFYPHYNFLNYSPICGIYGIYDNTTKSYYVGQSIDIIQRWEQHIKSKANTKIGKALKENGLENFTFQILEECSPLELDIKECEWIEKCNSFRCGYNSTRGNVGKVKAYNEWLQLHPNGI